MSSTSTPRTPGRDAPAEPDDLEEVLASQDWDEISVRLTRYAHVRLYRRSWAIAEEIAQEAIMRLLDAAYAPWDRERHPDVFDCLGHIVNGLAVNHVRKAGRVRMVPIREDSDAHDEDGPLDPRAHADDHAPPPDAVVLASEDGEHDGDAGADRRAAVAMSALRKRLEGDAITLALLDLIQQGEGKPLAQAKALRVSVGEVYTIKRRLMHHARLVGREMAQREQGES